MNHQVKASWHDILEQGVTLRLENAETADLAYRAAEGVLSPSLLDSLRFYKDSLCRLLRPGCDYLPLSPAQKRMWLLCRTNPGSPFYNMSLTTEFAGELNTAAFIKAIGELSQRHPVLRAAFPLIDGQPVQEIGPVQIAATGIEFIDLSDLEPALRLSRREELATEIATQSFDVERGPLWAARLLKLEPKRHALLLNIHHLLGDRWSLRLLFNDISYYYAQYSGQKPLRAYLAPPSYIDFILWQQRWLQSEECNRQIQYWNEKLQGVGPLASLPLQRRREQPSTRRGGSFSLHIKQSSTQKLRTLTQEADTTLFAVLLSAFKVLIRQCSGLDDIRIGSPVANRNRAVTRRAIAMLADNILLRTNLHGAQTFRDALERTKTTVEEAMRNQNVAFDQVAANTPLHGVSAFEVYFALLNISEKVAFPGLEVHTVQNETGTAKIDLAVRIREEENGLQVDFIYDADMIDSASVEHIATHYGKLLDAIAADFDIALADLPFDDALKTIAPAPKSVAHTATHQANDEPRDDLERQLAVIWQELLQVPRVGIRDDFFTLGGHSLLAVRLLDTVEKATGKTLSLAIFFQAPTIEGQAALLRNEGSLDIPSLVTLQPKGTCPPLFCIDGAVRYRALAESLAPDQPVYGLIPANPTDGQWYSFDKIGERAEHYLEIIKKVQPHGPYQLAGLSFAGLVALMIAKQLRDAGEEVHLLALFDTYGPGYFAMPFSRRVGLHLHALRKLDLSARAQYLRDRARLRLLKKSPESKAVNPEQPTNTEDAWQVDVFDRELSPEEINHLRSLAQHLRQEPSIARYEGKTVLFVARDKPMEFLQADTTLGWSDFASHLTIHQVPGDHTSLIQEPNVSELAALLRPALFKPPGQHEQ